jgi:hypothetical protein
MQIKNRIQMLENVIIDAQAAAGHVQGTDHETTENSSTSPSLDEHPETESNMSNVLACDSVTFQELNVYPNSDQILHLIDSDLADCIDKRDLEAWLNPNISYSNGSDTFSEFSRTSSMQASLICQNYNSVMPPNGINTHEEAVQESPCDIGGSSKLLFRSEPSTTAGAFGEGTSQQRGGSAKQNEVIFDFLLGYVILSQE